MSIKNRLTTYKNISHEIPFKTLNFFTNNGTNLTKPATGSTFCYTLMATGKTGHVR